MILSEKGSFGGLFLFYYICSTFNAMKKFFLFRREEDSISSGSTTSNTGVGISTISIPADHVSYMTTKKGGLIITFNYSGAFEDTFLKEGQSVPKTTVEVSCEEGKESSFMEQILNFISNPSGKSVMRFDSVGKNSTFSSFTETANSIKPVIPTLPVDTSTQEISAGDAQDQYQNTIGGINFLRLLPDIDFNHEGLSSFGDTDTVSSWPNAGLLGRAYSISSVKDTPECVDPNSRNRGLTTKSVAFVEEEYMTIPSYTSKGEYLLYIVWTSQYLDNTYNPYFLVMYGDAAGETLGPGGTPSGDGALSKLSLGDSRFFFRHSGKTNYPANAKSLVRIPEFIDPESVSSDNKPCHVLVVRRDKDFNIFVYDRSGSEVAFIPNYLRKNEGDLLIERLGTSGAIEGNSFNKGSISRFGVISKDPGQDFASYLAQNLFNYYNNI